MFVYSYTNFGMPLKSTFSYIIPRSCNSDFLSCLIPNVVGFSTFSLILIPTLTISSTSFLSSNIAWTIPFTSLLTWIATKFNFIFLLIPPYSLSKKDWNSCNEFVARFNIFKIKFSYCKNSKLKISFVPTKWFLGGKNGFIWNVVGKSCIHYFGFWSLVSKANTWWVDWTIFGFGF